MQNFTTITDAMNWLADHMGVSLEAAAWLYENTDCPYWNDDAFKDYEFLEDENIGNLPDELFN